MVNSGKVCLAMMVKNEEKTILKSLDSCKPVISSVKIYDTGSTDKTLEIIDKFALDNPNINVSYIKGEFDNFATSRNVLLDYVDLDTDVQFALLLDANDELHGTDAFKKFIESEKDKTRENAQYYCSGYLLRQKWFSGGSVDTYFNVRLVRVRHSWRYSHPVHEYISSKEETGGISIRVEHPEIMLYQDRTKDCESSFTRFKRDKDILLKEHLKNPEEPRICFYLAQTYGSLGMQDDAYYYYKLRLELGGYDEEIYHSYQRLGEIANNLNLEPGIAIGWWMKALEHTRRAEPAVKIANHYLYSEKGAKHYMAAAFTSLAIQMDYPIYCNLFVNRLDYDYTRYHLDGIAQYYVGGYKQGLDSCKKAIEYSDKMLKPILDTIQQYVTSFINNMVKLNPVSRGNTHYIHCIYLAQTGNMQHVNLFCFGVEKEGEEEVEVSDEDFVKQGNVKQALEYTKARVANMQTELNEGKKTREECQEIFKSNEQLIRATIFSLQKLVKMDDECRQLMNNIATQSMQRNMYEVKLETDKRNEKFYTDKLDEIKRQRKEAEINQALQEVEKEIERQTQRQVTKKAQKKKKGKR